MKKKTGFWSILTDGIDWEKMNTKQRCVSVWFGMSFVLLGICGESLLLATAMVANFCFASYNVVKHVPKEGE